LVVLRTISHRVTNWRWCNIRTGLIVPLHWWWIKLWWRRRRIHLLLWWIIWTRCWRWWRIYSWKIINLVTHFDLLPKSHKKRKKKDFHKPNINSITCWSLILVVVVTHCWNQDMISPLKNLFGILKNQMNEMKYCAL